MEVGIFNGIKKDSRTQLTEERTTKDRHVQHGSEEAKEGRGSDDDSAGCEVEETTMLTDNEPAPWGVGGCRGEAERRNRDRGGAQSSRPGCDEDVERCTRDCHGGYHVLDVLILQKFKSLRVGIFRSMIGPLPPTHADEV